MRSASKDRWFAVISVFLATAGALLAAEAVLRISSPAWLRHRMLVLGLERSDASFNTDREWRTQSRNGRFWRFEPNSEADVSSHEFHYTAHIDEFGARAVVRVERGGGPKRLVPFLGDSFTFGI